jgi:hypothetical protein
VTYYGQLTCVCLQVALGDMFEIDSNSGVNIGNLPAGLPDGRLSVKGRGRFSPSPDGFETLSDGIAPFLAYLLVHGFMHQKNPTHSKSSKVQETRVACSAHCLCSGRPHRAMRGGAGGRQRKQFISSPQRVHRVQPRSGST